MLEFGEVVAITVEEFLEILRSSVVIYEAVPRPYPHGTFKEKTSLSALEWQQLIDETRYISAECKSDLSSVGGTRSSARVRRANAHLETLETLRTKPTMKLSALDFAALFDDTQVALATARGSLAKHNSQAQKFVTYDLETGGPLNEPDYRSANPIEILQSMGLISGPQRAKPNRFQKRMLKKIR